MGEYGRITKVRAEFLAERRGMEGVGVSTYDLVIRNGTVVDGSGLGSYRADVGIVGDRIAFVGRIRERGSREIDAEGHVVTPGFVDGHTHMDAQVFWDASGQQLVLARRHDRGDGQLRVHARAGAARRARRWWCATSSGPRTSTPPRSPPASTGPSRPSPSTSTRSTGCRRASTSPPTSATRRCAPGRWASGPSTRRRPTTT